MLGPESPGKNVVKQIFRIVQVHLDFFKNHLALLADIVRIKLGAEHEVGNHIKGDREVLVEDLSVEADLLL